MSSIFNDLRLLVSKYVNFDLLARRSSKLNSEQVFNPIIFVPPMSRKFNYFRFVVIKMVIYKFFIANSYKLISYSVISSLTYVLSTFKLTSLLNLSVYNELNLES